MDKTVKQVFDFKQKITLPEVVLPSVLPTDAASLITLLHSVVASHRNANEMLHDYLNQAQVCIAESQAQVAQAQGRVDHLLEQILLARRRMFGASSEQSDGQGQLFNEAEALALGSTEEQNLAVIPEVKDPATPKTPADRKTPRGKRAVTAETDLLLCRYFGLSDGWWLAVQSHHDTQLARRELGARLKKISRCPLLTEALPG